MQQKSLPLAKVTSIAAGGLPLQDYIVSVIHDKTKDAYLMTNHRARGGLWFPFSERHAHETSLQTIKRLLESVALPETDQIHLARVCSTKTLPCRARDVLFYAVVPKPTVIITLWLNGKIDGIDFERQLDSLSDNGSVWVTTTQLRHLSKSSRLMGTEPLSLNKQFKDIFYFPTRNNNLTPNVIFEEVKIPQVEHNPKTTPSTAETLLLSAKFTSTIQEQLFEAYHQAVVPCDYLNIETFKALISNLGLESHRSIDYFRAFDATQRNYLTFLEYLLGLAALDPNTQHGGVPAEQRCRYIFRFYNSSNNQRMSFDEFKWMIKDIHKSKGQNLTGDALTEEASQMFRSFGLRSTDQTLSLMDFLSGVGQLRFRGTSVLFRSTAPIADLLKQSTPSSVTSTAIVPSSHQVTSIRNPSTSTVARKMEISQRLSNVCADDGHPYEIATHIVKVRSLLRRKAELQRWFLGEKNRRRRGYHISVRFGDHWSDEWEHGSVFRWRHGQIRSNQQSRLF